jgi:hypothetical protein
MTMKPYFQWDPHDGLYEDGNGDLYMRSDVDPVLAALETDNRCLQILADQKDAQIQEVRELALANWQKVVRLEAENARLKEEITAMQKIMGNITQYGPKISKST